MTFTGVGTVFAGNSSSLSCSPHAVGDILLVEVISQGNSSTVSTMSGGGVSSWSRIAADASEGTFNIGSVWMGTVSSTGAATITIGWSGIVPPNIFSAGQEFGTTAGATLDTFGTLTRSSNTMPALTPAAAGELYFGYCLDSGTPAVGSTPGYVYQIDPVNFNDLAYNANCTASVQAPVWGDSTLFYGLAVLLKPVGGASHTATAAQVIAPASVVGARLGISAQAALAVTPVMTASPSGGVLGVVVAQAVSGNVINDYGLDDVPFALKNPGLGSMLVAFTGWDVATQTYESPGLAPAVNVTDSAGNLWRQIGITAMTPVSRSAIWVADNPRQVSWVSVALTGWGYSTGYTIVELNNVPSTLGAVSLDFVSTAFSASPTTSLSVPTATATSSDIVFGIITTGGGGGPLTIPTGWTGIAAVGGATTDDVAVYSMFRPNVSAGTVPFNPGWANSAPSSGIIVGLQRTASAPVQANPNFPALQVEAAFGATPGNWTQSVDYTWSIEGLTWTDISSYVIGQQDDARISAKRGRQYELSQEEAGELDISLDNHTGVFTYGNTASPFYPYVIPGTPLRVTAWFGGIQYPVGFGYAQKWPQEWPQMPQWGFSNVTAADAYGPLASASMFSAVMGEVRKEAPYAYFPTEEQYEFTTQSLDPVQAPLDANGLIAVNYAFGNNRSAAYRDGSDQPVTVGQALNLMGDQNTTLGAASYTGQEINDNGPGMFYFDPNIPTNASGGSFSVEFWFAWGYGPTANTTLFSAWGQPSSFYVPSSVPTNGGVLTVGINTPAAATATTGFFVNGIDVTQGQFNQTTLAPQHFVLTAGPNGTACYLNGVQQGTAPTLATIPSLRALSLGPARFSYDVSDLVVYNGFNYVAGHLAWYPRELTPTMISNHYEAGITGFAGDPAPGRFAQILTWGGLGLKRGGTAWYGQYGNPESTYMAEAYQLEGSSASDAISQVVNTEGGRAYTQANGSLVYTYRWAGYNPPSVATFGDAQGELPYYNETSFATDNQFIFNVINATQTRGPNQDLFYQENDFTSQYEYFMRSGLSLQSYALLPFDVQDVVNWSLQRYREPVPRVVQVVIDVAGTQQNTPGVFPAILSLELNQVVTVIRRPIGGAVMAVTGVIQKIDHEIGPAYWKTTLQVTPLGPGGNALVSDVSGDNSPGTSYLSW